MNKNYNENYVREAAYYNWQNAGCPSGKDEYFWTMAINQLYGDCNCSNSTSACSCKKSSTKTSAKSSSAKTSSSRKTSKK